MYWSLSNYRNIRTECLKIKSHNVFTTFYMTKLSFMCELPNTYFLCKHINDSTKASIFVWAVICYLMEPDWIRNK